MVEGEDVKWVKLAANGDNAAFAHLVVKYQGRVAALLYRFFGGNFDVEDVVQDVFIKVYKNLDSFRYDASFYTWLYRIAINTAKNHLGKLKVSRLHTEIDGILPDSSLVEGAFYDSASPERELEGKELKEVIFTAIGALSADLKSVLLLRELSGLTYEEISSILECPVGTVRSRLFRAREFVSMAIFRATGENIPLRQNHDD